jgi:hypothetical protein
MVGVLRGACVGRQVCEQLFNRLDELTVLKRLLQKTPVPAIRRLVTNFRRANNNVWHISPPLEAQPRCRRVLIKHDNAGPSAQSMMVAWAVAANSFHLQAAGLQHGFEDLCGLRESVDYNDSLSVCHAMDVLVGHVGNRRGGVSASSYSAGGYEPAGASVRHSTRWLTSASVGVHSRR